MAAASQANAPAPTQATLSSARKAKALSREPTNAPLLEDAKEGDKGVANGPKDENAIVGLSPAEAEDVNSAERRQRRQERFARNAS